MPRTTIALDVDLLRRLKRMAADRGISLTRLVSELLRGALENGSRPKPYKLVLEGWTATLQPGVDLTDRDALFDLMDGR